MNNTYLFTSESVTEGHPDKVADQISDAILDAILIQDPDARVACETVVNTGLVLVFGEVTTSAYVDIQAVVRKTINDIGYNKPQYGFEGNNVAVLVSLDEQSPDIKQGVDQALEVRESEEESLGAGDQGIIFGYACNETETYMPLAIDLAHKMAFQLASIRKNNILDYLGPDGKTQVTIEYKEDGTPLRVDNIVVSTQHDEAVSLEQIRKDIITYVVEPIIPNEWLDENTTYYINPTGKFVIGGPVGDSGLTGRKIIVDTYGGAAHHGGGAFSGKDATKVDRSASYAARYVAKNIVAAGIADSVEIQLAYAIGVAEPTSIHLQTTGLTQCTEGELIQIVREVFDLTPSGIIHMLDLKRPIYKQTAAYGHFGRTDIQLPWEQTDKIEVLKDKIAELR